MPLGSNDGAMLEQQRRQQAALQAHAQQNELLDAAAPLLMEASHEELQEQHLGVQQVALVGEMPVEAEIEQQAPSAQVQRRGFAQKMKESLERTRAKWARRRARREPSFEESYQSRVHELDEQQMYEQLRAIAEYEADQIRLAGEGGAPAEGELTRIHWEAQADRVAELDRYAKLLPLGSMERAAAMKKKEEMAVRADYLRRKYRVTQIENPVERKREEKTLKRHAKYDSLKKVFRKDNPLAHEDAEWTLPNGHTLVNVGRAFFGGTKPMYIFEDRQAPIVQNGAVVGYQQYLFKEAVNCIGMEKPEGALVTEAAANLQTIICGEYAIPAYAAKQGNRVLGSFQKKLDVWQQPEGKIDLFAWQAAPDDSLSAEIKCEILREHTLDWLLCNFDTKGENFLQRTDGHLSSFDKEASFSKLDKDAAKKMSTTYKPHANDTLYNTIFTEFAAGRVTLDLNSTLEQLHRIEGMGREEYLGMFDAMLTQKYGKKGKSRRQAEQAIWERKTGLRDEYCRFYGELIGQRRAARAKAGQPDDYAGRTDENGRFIFDVNAQ